MPKLTIELDTKTHQILKQRAKEDERSLTQYIQRVLRQSAGTLTITSGISIPTTTSSVVKPVVTPTTISTPTAEEPLTPIQKVRKEKQLKGPTVEEFIIFLDNEGISPDDGSFDLYDGIKKQVYKNLDFDVFCDAQEKRRERRQNETNQDFINRR